MNDLRERAVRLLEIHVSSLVSVNGKHRCCGCWRTWPCDVALLAQAVDPLLNAVASLQSPVKEDVR